MYYSVPTPPRLPVAVVAQHVLSETHIKSFYALAYAAMMREKQFQQHYRGYPIAVAHKHEPIDPKCGDPEYLYQKLAKRPHQPDEPFFI